MSSWFFSSSRHASRYRVGDVPIKERGDLNLAHLRAAGGAAGDTTTNTEAGDDSRGDERGETEPEEGGDGLALAALLGAVGGGAGDLVGEKVTLQGRSR